MASRRRREEEPLFGELTEFRGARAHAVPRERLEEVRRAARRLNGRLLDAAPVAWYQGVELVRAPYPVKYGLRDAARVPTPLMHIVNRMFVVQFEHAGHRFTLLVSPTDVESARETPYFRRLARAFGPLAPRVADVIGPVAGTVESRLAELGLRAEDIDFITFDHLHTQDIRKWLGTHDRPGYFPRAKLLVMRQEWESCRGLLPTQADWYRPSGTDGIPEDRVILLDGDTLLGESVALVHTPGHTEGNHSVAVRTPEGVFVTSENGVGPDAYSPLASKIPGVAEYARNTGAEVVLNGNTLERGLDQYISMVAEKEIAGPSSRNPDFFGTMCSSEMAAFALFVGLKPTFSFGDLCFRTGQ